MILCFSGTGNSRLVAQHLSRALGQPVVMVGHDLLQRPSLTVGDGMVVWVFPIYSWGIPPVIRQLTGMLRLSSDGDIVHHLVCTCGDDVGLAPEMFRRDIAARGWTAGGVWSVTMPNNYVTMRGFDVDDVEVSSAKLAGMPRRVMDVAKAIMAGAKETDVVRGHFAFVKTKIIYPWFVRHAMSPKPFGVVDKQCIGCGKCVVTCPMGNVRLVARRPMWGDRCAFCLACYHVCPRHAVAYGNKTMDKGQYMAPR